MKKQLINLMAAAALLCALGTAHPSLAADTPAPKADAAVVATPPAADALAPAAAANPAPAAAMPSATTPTVPAAAAAAPGAAAAPAAPAAAAAPVPNKGDTAWMMTATVLVILMTIPGLALFYGGLVRSKNMLSILMQIFMIFAVIVVLWCVYGYSLAFTEGNAFIGKFDRLMLNGIWDPSKASFAAAATFSKGVVIPEFIFVAFQATFAAITCGLIVGAFAERAKFSAVLAFIVLWFTFSYLPVAHMVWFWTGPDMITSAESAGIEAAKAGWLFQKGALDFAGGTVVHINAGIAGLVGCLIIGPRLGFGKEATPPHSLTMTMIGASLLWVGWFGFNAGSNLEANGVAAVAFVNTMLATCAAALSWAVVEQIVHKKPSMLGAVSGAVAGLVAITPASGFGSPMSSIVLGLIVSPLCFFFVSTVKNKFKYDDTLDVFGIHCIGGITGALATGIVASPALGGQGWIDYTVFPAVPGAWDTFGQMKSQLWAVGTTLVWSGGISALLLVGIDKTIGLRASEEAEREGLDLNEHGERAYNM